MIPPTEVWDEAPTRCLVVNEKWLAHVMGLLERATKSGYWDANELDGFDGILAIQDAMGNPNCETMILQHDIIKAEHHASVNVAGGATVANAWTQLPITRIVQDSTGLTTLSANTLTIPAGKWRFNASHFFKDSAGVQGRIRVTFSPTADPTTDFHYYSLNARNVGDIELCPAVQDYFNLGEPIDVEMWYRMNAAEATNGLGVPLNIGVEDERYGEIMLERFTLVPE